jgi:hypothetical protein
MKLVYNKLFGRLTHLTYNFFSRTKNFLLEV